MSLKHDSLVVSESDLRSNWNGHPFDAGQSLRGSLDYGMLRMLAMRSRTWPACSSRSGLTSQAISCQYYFVGFSFCLSNSTTASSQPPMLLKPLVNPPKRIVELLAIESWTHCPSCQQLRFSWRHRAKQQGLSRSLPQYHSSQHMGISFPGFHHPGMACLHKHTVAGAVWKGCLVLSRSTVSSRWSSYCSGTVHRLC